MNKNKLLDLLISNLSNVVVHQILEKAIDKPEIAGFYKKESLNSFEIAKNYRDKINPTNRPLTFDDLSYVRDKLIRKVKNELYLRISKGYRNIDVSLVDDITDNLLKTLMIL